MNDFTTDLKKLVHKHLTARPERVRVRPARLKDICATCVNAGCCGADLQDMTEDCRGYMSRCRQYCPTWPGIALVALSMAPFAVMFLATGWLLIECLVAAGVLLVAGFAWFVVAGPVKAWFVRRRERRKGGPG